jgi:hypothetical protein
MRVLHISDLHATGTDEPDQREIVEAALADITTQDQEQRVDLVIFSGDLGFDGTPETFERGRALLLQPLSERLPGRPIALVPGNHDINRDRISQFLEKGLQETLKTRGAVADLLNAPADLEQATARLEDWREFETAWYDDAEPQRAGPLATAFKYAIAGASVGVACLNTAWRAQGGDEDRGRLLVGEPQTDAALEAIHDCEIRIVVMHHPLDWLVEFDATRTRAQLEGSGVFVLTGHDHSPDPTMEMSTRGAALYSRAGCLYSGHAYSNSFTLLDIDARRRGARVTIRRWWPARRAFDQATDLHNSGCIELPWPHPADALPVQRAALPDVVSPLAEIAQEHSVLVDHADTLEHATVSDLLIAPRFWPVPHKEAVDPAVGREARPRTVDPVERLAQNRVVIVSGPHFSGVTSALLWLLERHFRLRGTHAPAYVRIDPRMSLGRLNDAVALGVARAGERPDSGTPVLLAIDDAAPPDSRALGRLVRFLNDHPEATLLIGTHGEDHAAIAETLKARGLTHERLFLGPFGRRELRQLVARMVGPESGEVVQRVLRTIHRQRLPRNPLNIAALVSVLAREPDLTTINESGLLQSYVNVLLENPTGVDPEGLAMDYRRREHLLERLANVLVRSNRSRITRLEIEHFVLEYFSEIGWRAGSAGHLVDSLIRRRVLSEDNLGVGFRYPALLHLFAAKWMLEDPAFSDYVLADPTTYGEIIRHAAGLRRNARDLLVKIGDVATQALQYGAQGITVKQFDLMRDQHGWSQVKDLDHVRELVEPPPQPPSEEELDEIYEEVADAPPETPDTAVLADEHHSLTAVDRIEASVRLLASVLQSSELVADIDLKADLLQKVIFGWSISTVVLAVQEDESGVLRELFEEILAIEDPERRRSLAEHISRVLVVAVMTFGLYADVGSVHLQGVMDRVLDDKEFMSETAHALFATMLYAMLELPRWPERLGALHRAHGRHPIVQELVREWALRQYHARSLVRRDEAALEELLVQLLTPERLPTGSVADRAAQKSQILEDVRQSRIRERFARGPADDDEEGEDIDAG